MSTYDESHFRQPQKVVPIRDAQGRILNPMEVRLCDCGNDKGQPIAIKANGSPMYKFKCSDCAADDELRAHLRRRGLK